MKTDPESDELSSEEALQEHKAIMEMLGDVTLHYPPRVRVFLSAIVNNGANITTASEIAGMCRKSHYDRLSDLEGYVEVFERAQNMAYDKIEQEAYRRAVCGAEETVYYQGKSVGKKKVFSGRLLERVLEAKKPQEYVKRVKAQLGGGGAEEDPIVIAIQPPTEGEPDAAEAPDTPDPIAGSTT